MWPWDELGLAPTGDERLIRKAYAERARENRPDDDQAAFIRLRAAYEAALAAAARIAASEAGETDKIVQLDGFRDRPVPPKPEPIAKPPPGPIRIERPAFPEAEPAAEPTAKAPIPPRARGVRIERIGESEPVAAPKPQAAPKPRIRIERVAPAAETASPPSTPPARPRVRIERVVPETESTPSDGSAEAERCPPGKS